MTLKYPMNQAADAEDAGAPQEQDGSCIRELSERARALLMRVAAWSAACELERAERAGRQGREDAPDPRDRFRDRRDDLSACTLYAGPEFREKKGQKDEEPEEICQMPLDAGPEDLVFDSSYFERQEGKQKPLH